MAKLRLVVAAIVVVALSGCGSSGGSSSTASPQQSDNLQRDGGYVRAINQIMAPFSKPPASETDYAGGARKLHVAISQLGGLTPPPQFAPSQTHLVAGLRAQAALAPRFERASAAHDSVRLSNLESQLLSAERVIRTATHEMVSAYNQCRGGSFRTC
jgi:hypothetical protein